LFKKIGDIMGWRDDRTDNWGGHRDVNRDPNNWRFPRTAREAGLGDYRSMHKEEWSFCGICVAIGLILLVVGLVSWAK
jgi:hypothetical protein